MTGALWRWLHLKVQQQTLTPEALESIPVTVSPQRLPQAISYLHDPGCDPTRLADWWQSVPWIGVGADLGLASGQKYLAEKPERAAACWERVIAQNSHMMDQIAIELEERPGASFSDGPASVLGLYENLAALYQSIPDLDPGGTKLKRMVQQLFEGKWMYIRQKNWEATQAFHTTLAIIFLARGELGNEQEPSSAIFQLKAALDDAKRREREEGFYQPLPEMRAQLAAAYRKTGKADLAAVQYREATLAYLDVDAVGTAEETLASWKNLGGATDEPSRIVKLIELRKREGLDLAELDSSHSPWLYRATAGIPADFLARQRFKLYADQVMVASKGTTMRLDAAQASYSELVKDRPKLVGAADVARWATVQRILLGAANAVPESSYVIAQSGGHPRDGIAVTVPGEARPFYVAVDPRTTIAAQYLAAVGSKDAVALQPHVVLRNGKISLPADLIQGNASDAIERLKNNPNLLLELRPARTAQNGGCQLPFAHHTASFIGPSYA